MLVWAMVLHCSLLVAFQIERGFEMHVTIQCLL